MRHHVVLIPGFFGFVNLGELTYFKHVRTHITEWAKHNGINVVVHRPRTPPTAALSVRAHVLHALIQYDIPEGEPIHLIGHSAGGLDARWLTSPTTTLDGDASDTVAKRVNTVVCVSSPHRGTPLATLFDSVMGGSLLRLFSTLSTCLLYTSPSPRD